MCLTLALPHPPVFSTGGHCLYRGGSDHRQRRQGGTGQAYLKEGGPTPAGEGLPKHRYQPLAQPGSPGQQQQQIKPGYTGRLKAEVSHRHKEVELADEAGGQRWR